MIKWWKTLSYRQKYAFFEVFQRLMFLGVIAGIIYLVASGRLK